LTNSANQIDGRLARPLLVLLGTAAFLIIFGLFAAMAKLITPHSDGACPALYAQAVLDGNPGLRGWDLTTVGFYTELPFYIVGVKVLDLQADVMRFVPAFIYALNVALIAALVWKYRIRHKAWILLPVLALLVLPANGVWQHALTPALHHVTATLGFCLLLLLNDRLVVEGSKLKSALLFTVALLATWGDLAFLFLFALPLAVSGTFLHLGDTASRRAFYKSVLAPVFLGVVFGHLGIKGMTLLGFGTPVGIGSMLFETKENIPIKAEILLDSWVRFFGFDVWSKPVSLITVCMAFMGVGIVCWVVACWGALRRRDSGFDLFCVATPAVTTLAVVFSNRGDFLDDTRFIVPSFFLAIVLIARELQRRSDSVLWRAVPVVLVAASAFVASQFFNSNRFLLAGDAYASDLRRTAETLERQGIRKGFGDFWACQVLRVVSKGTLEITPVSLAGDGSLAERRWASDRRWFDDPSGRFAVFRGLDADEQQHLQDAAIAMWGQPAKTLDEGQMRILIWDSDRSLSATTQLPVNRGE
jgi:hypothetical protein